MLSVEHVSKAFAGVQALDDVNVEIGVNEVVGLVGENGAGKSTLMRILAGGLFARPRIAEIGWRAGFPQEPPRCQSQWHRNRIPGTVASGEPHGGREHLSRTGSRVYPIGID